LASGLGSLPHCVVENHWENKISKDGVESHNAREERNVHCCYILQYDIIVETPSEGVSNPLKKGGRIFINNVETPSL
jgi:hypothetical protein